MTTTLPKPSTGATTTTTTHVSNPINVTTTADTTGTAPTATIAPTVWPPPIPSSRMPGPTPPVIAFTATVNISEVGSSAAFVLRVSQRLQLPESSVIVDSFDAASGAVTFHLAPTASGVAASLAANPAVAVAALGLSSLNAAVDVPAIAIPSPPSKSRLPIVAVVVPVCAVLAIMAGVVMGYRYRQRARRQAIQDSAQHLMATNNRLDFQELEQGPHPS